MGGSIGNAFVPRRFARRKTWSRIIIGTFVCAGAGLPRAFAAQDSVTPPPAVPRSVSQSGVETTARVPGSDAPTFAQGGWNFTAKGASDFSFTDNVYLTDANRLSDFIVSPQGYLTARHTSTRTAINADVDVTYDYYAKNTRLNGARPHALVDGYVELFEDNVTLDARVATDVQQINSEDRVPAFRRNLDRNQTQVLNYGVTPTVLGRLGSGIAARASYDYSSVRFLDPPVDPDSGATPVRGGDTERHIARGSIGNEESAGSRLLWTASGYYEQALIDEASSTDLVTRRRPERSNGEGRLEYHISAPFALVARGGYDSIDEPTLLEKPDGAYGLGGFIWRPSRRTIVHAEVGYRYRDFNGEADINYQASEALTISASYRRDIQSAQRILLESLGGLVRDRFGNLVDPITGLPPDPNATRFDITNQAFKRDQFRLGVFGAFYRNFYSLSADYEHRSANGAAGDSWGVSAVVGRDITPRLQASLSASHAKVTSDPGITFTIRDSKTTSAGARLDYEVTRSVRASARYAYMHRTSTVARYHENALILSVSKTF